MTLSPPPPLLTHNEPLPYRIFNPSGSAPLLLVCDHASNHIPAHLNNLGLDTDALEDHVAWDPGAARVTELICDRLNCRAVLANYSRLLIDLNRDPAVDELSTIPQISDHYPIPGNQSLTETQRAQRIEYIHEPYHRAIDAQLNELSQWVAAPLLFSIHTFTPVMRGCDKPRPWHAGMLWNNDPRLAMPLMEYLHSHDHLCIGDNQPYSGRDIAYTMMRHGDASGFANCAIEIRQDLLKDQDDCLWWAEHLAQALEQILAKPGIHQQEFFQSH